MEIENYRVKKAHDMDIPDDVDDQEDAHGHALDSEESKRKHSRLMDWYTQERERQSINRYQQAIDEDFYDHLQWSEEEAQELTARGQAPLVFNEIKPTIDWIIGTEKRTRIDGKVFPRGEEDVDGAEVKTKLLKYLSDANKTPFARSFAFADAVKVGIGWLEDGIRLDPDKEMLYTRYESWRNVLYDSNSVERDLSDARYLFRWRWLDTDIAQAYFPERADKIRSASVSSELFGPEQDEDIWYLGNRLQTLDASGQAMGRRSYVSDALTQNRRERVKLIECWYREPVRIKTCCGGIFDGKDFDERNAGMVQAREGKEITLYDRISMKMHVAIMTENDLIADSVSPYRHNRFGLTPIWGYRRKRDNAPYGVIRGLRDPQEDLNKRHSKALFILSSNRVVADKDAVDDWEELRQEVARPDSIIIKNANKELRVERDVQLAEEHLTLMDRDRLTIRNIGGVTPQNLGQDDKGLSGLAIGKLQEQGSVVTAELFDNMRFAAQLEGENQLSLIEQYFTQAKVARVIGNKGKIEWLPINKVDPITGQVLNDITASQADFVIGEQDYRISLRQAMFETLSDMVSRMQPDLALKFLDLVFEISDIEDKEEFVARIRQINGFTPADEKLTPEQEQEKKAQADKVAEAEMIQKETLLLTIDKLAADIEKIRADARRIDADATGKGVESQYSAVQAGATIATNPGVAAVADALLKSAGYKDLDAPPIIPQASAAPLPTIDSTVPQNTSPMHPPSAASGLNRGIETQRIEPITGGPGNGQE